MVQCLNYGTVLEVTSSPNLRTKPIKHFSKYFADNNVTGWFIAATRNRSKYE